MDPIVLVEQCYQKLPSEMKAKPWEATGHGRKVLTSEDELNAYIAAYGEMHIVKCRAALQNFPFEDLGMYSYEIFDWGCGQGLATLTLLDMLSDRGMLSRLEKICLIEPSMHALRRAEAWVKQNAGPGIKVESVNKYIPADINSKMDDVKCSSRISINLFSNILDIRSLSLLWLANKTASLANTNYMICIGPKFTQNTNTRILDFCGYFNTSEYFSDINSFPYSYTTRTHHAYGCETKCFVHQRGSLIDNSYRECAVEELNIDPYDYAADVMCGIVDDELIRFYQNLRESAGTYYDVFFRPAINCDTVDFVLTSKSKGIILINACKDLSNLEDAVKRIENVKDNLFNIHLRTIKIDSVVNKSVFNCVKCALFFPNNTDLEVNAALAQINANINTELDRKGGGTHNKDHFAYLYRFTPTSNLKESLERISSRSFRYDYYEELVNIISSKWHTYKEGDLNFRLSQRQREIVRSGSKRLRVKGVAGCGKTQVVANRAVEQHLKSGERVLIVTFNISLIQYIRMRIGQVPADFSPNMFEVINYHQFFKSKANLYAQGRDISLADYDSRDFFTPCRDKINKYKSIIIDEVQDFKESWLQSIISNFLSDDGSVSLFGDGEQNIYDRELEAETKMPPIRGCGFTGRWNEMSERISMRIINPKIASLSSEFARSFMENKSPLAVQEGFVFDEYFIKYWKISNQTLADTLAGNIRWILSEHKINAEDVVVLGQSINLLRDVEAAYVRATNLKTMINFETAQQYEEVKKNTSPTFIRKDLEEIRRAAKTHFTTACDCLKLSTIHSFKGWESKTVILLLQPEVQSDETLDGYRIQERENSPALIYTALTRAKCNLFLLNLDNSNYHAFFTNNIQ